MHINVLPRWDFENDQGQKLHPMVPTLLKQINRCGRLTAAAKACDLSYRYAWNLLQQSNTFFGHPLVLMERGKGAQLTALGQKLLWSNQRIEARIQPEMEGLATEINVELQSTLATHIPVVRIYASHGYAVALMTQFTRHYQVEIHYHSPQQALIALNEGRCRVAGFHQPIGMDIPSQKARYQKLLDPKRFGIIRFVRRQQGLIFPKANPHNIAGIESLTQHNLRFINRQNDSGTRKLLEQLLTNNAINTNEITGYENQEYTHSAVAAHIASDMADLGFGIETAARRFELGFIPIIEEYYLWAYPLEAEMDEDIQVFINTLSDPEFQKQINQLPGYHCDHCGVTTTTDWLLEQH
jgi:molybdate transport repressor ModE-like protein